MADQRSPSGHLGNLFSGERLDGAETPYDYEDNFTSRYQNSENDNEAADYDITSNTILPDYFYWTTQSVPATSTNGFQVAHGQYGHNQQQYGNPRYLSSIAPKTFPSVWAENDQWSQRALNNTPAFQLDSDQFVRPITTYAPLPHQPAYIDDPNDIPTPPVDSFRRRGPDINAIEKRRERDPTFFCGVQGCNSVGFTTRGNLKRHVNDKHYGKQNICIKCFRAFADSTSVDRHLRDMHGLRRDGKDMGL